MCGAARSLQKIMRRLAQETVSDAGKPGNYERGSR